MSYEIVRADVIHWAETYTGEKFMAILCDPPYHLTSKKGSKGGFMNAAWDGEAGGRGIAFRPETWAALAEHLHPGGFIMAFGGARTYHRLACAIEDAGLVIQPAVYCWVTGQSFCKATNISRLIDKRVGAEREVLGIVDTRSDYDGKERHSPAINRNWRDAEGREDYRDLSRKVVTAPATELAKTWQGHRYGGAGAQTGSRVDSVCPKALGQGPADRHRGDRGRGVEY